MITAGMTFSKTAITAFDNITENWKQAVEAGQKTARTDIAVINAEITSERVRLYLHNAGKVQLTNFINCDIIAHYYDQDGDYHIYHLTYTDSASPETGEWVVKTIYSTQDLESREEFQPGILDQGEVAVLEINLPPLPGIDTTGWVVLSTENGETT